MADRSDEKLVRPDGFAMIPDWFLRLAVPAFRLNGSEVAVYVALVGRTDAEKKTRPSVALIAEEAGVGENTVRDAIATLERVGLISVVTGKGRAHRYQVMPRPDHFPTDAPPRTRRGGANPSGNRTPAVTADHPSEVRCPPQRSSLTTPAVTADEVDTRSRHTSTHSVGDLAFGGTFRGSMPRTEDALTRDTTQADVDERSSREPWDDRAFWLGQTTTTRAAS